MMSDIRRREFITLLGGAAAAWPVAARAQQSAMPVIGFMSSRSPEDSVNVLTAFRRGLGEGGLIEGENVAIEFRWARGAYQELPALAAELVSRRVAVLVAVGGDPSALAAKAATSSIPIVFNSTDPIKLGLVASLNRPGGNATGVYILTSDLEPKRLGLLHELFPGVGLFGVMLNPKFPAAARQAVELAEAARTIGRPIILLNASTAAELDAAPGCFGAAACRSDASGGRSVLRHPARSYYRLRGTTEAARPLPISRICNGRWVNELWRELSRSLSRSRHLCGEDSQWSEARGPPGDAIG
jgi:ABC transporter substrate binding protein